MSTFKRYLSVFLAIGTFFLIVGLIFIAKDKRLFNWKFISFYLMAICIYVFPMSGYLSHQASTVNIRINNTNADTMNKIEDISTNKCNRKNKETHNNEVMYCMSDSFGAWLTNPIKVSNFGDYLILNVPRAYEKYYKGLL